MRSVKGRRVMDPPSGGCIRFTVVPVYLVLRQGS